MNSDYLFPSRLVRRDFLKASALAGAATAAGLTSMHSQAADAAAPAAVAAAPVVFGSGKWTYTLDPAFGALPDGMKYGHGCGIVVDGRDRVIVTSRSTSPCVAIFEKSGKLIETWSKDFGDQIGYTTEQVAGTAHCIYWSKEGDQEFLYFTENVGGPEKKLGKRVYKTDLAGKVLHTIGNVAEESTVSKKFEWTNPTDVAVAPNGDIYVVDGYGSQKVSRFDKNWKHITTIGKRGKGQDEFNTCHGIWINTAVATPEVWIADRGNGRIQIYDLALTYQRTVTGPWLRNPCCFYQYAGHFFIPDLAAQVLILDAQGNHLATLGDGKTVPKAEKDGRPEFIAPHALTVDSEGSLYVCEWVPYGRVRKFRHTPA